MLNKIKHVFQNSTATMQVQIQSHSHSTLGPWYRTTKKPHFIQICCLLSLILYTLQWSAEYNPLFVCTNGSASEAFT